VFRDRQFVFDGLASFEDSVHVLGIATRVIQHLLP
jgi:hypothetical protein